MVECAHFIYANFGDQGYQLYTSSNLKKVLSDDFNSVYHERVVKYLRTLGEGAVKEDTVELWWPYENIVSGTYLRPETDGYGRKTVYNHTIIAKITDYLQLYPPLKLFDKHFIRQLEEQPVNPLPPIKVENNV